MRQTFEIFADYFQICLTADPDLDRPDDITDEACRRRIVVATGAVTIMPERNMTVPLTVEVVAAPPPVDLAAWDHVVEASLDLPHGRLAVTDLVGSFSRIFAVAPGAYRLRFCGAAFESSSPDGLDGDDHYLVTLWPAAMAPLTVLKQWEG